MINGAFYYPGSLPESGTSLTGQLQFTVVVNDKEMLDQLNRLMIRQGYAGVMDTAGRLHYLVDGRKGMPYASRKILEATGRMIKDQCDNARPLQASIGHNVDKVLMANGIRPELKGYRYIRCMLLLIGLDETRIKPVTKVLYPDIANHFHVKASQVERDVRYALQETRLHRSGLTTTACLCRLHQQLVQAVEHDQLSEIGQTRKTPRQNESAEGSLDH
ncbi:MAG: hypothetical protein GX112_07245 [Clostridiaceae bacterium]|nr:hypothetical protein [Clostridiaceae bacterium]